MGECTWNVRTVCSVTHCTWCLECVWCGRNNTVLAVYGKSEYAYAEEIIGDHRCGFRRNRSTTDHIFCIRQILEKKWEHNEAVHQLFIDFKKA